jgi:methyltransferase (TIGR00027 family)
MKPKQSSLTAEGIAYLRLVESRKPEGVRLFNDPYARYFVSPLLYITAELFSPLARRRSPGVMEFLLARTKYIDDTLQTCLENGIRQLVVLGAGFDSRCYRFASAAQIRAFEVDHPATQARKLAGLRRIFGGRLPAHVTFVPVDFNTQSLQVRLLECGYDPALRTLFIWEGVTQYLQPEAVDATLAFIAQHSGPGSTVVFDYVYSHAVKTVSHSELRSMHRYQRLTGESIVFGIPEGTILNFMEQRGFCNGINVSQEDFKAYFPPGTPVAGDYAIVRAETKKDA